MYFKRQDICAEGRTIKEMKIKVYQIRNVYLDDDEEDFLKTAISFFSFLVLLSLENTNFFREKFEKNGEGSFSFRFWQKLRFLIRRKLEEERKANWNH